MKRFALVLALSACAACTHSNGSGDDASTTGTPTSTPTATPTPAPGPAGVWNVSGQDGIGSYAGQAELIADGTGYRLLRVIRYSGITVEDGRELWWAWNGTADGSLLATVPLAVGDFIRSRGALTRTPADAFPIAVAGTITKSADGMAAVWNGPGIAATETWTWSGPSGATPIFAGPQRTLVAAHDPPDATTKATLFGTFASYQALPDVAPYSNDPAFQAAVHGYWVDATDLAFYRANPNALRVVDKVIDPISLQETVARANAFGKTLAAKADFYDGEMPASFIDPAARGIMADSNVNGTLVPTGDGSLWTSTWIASQAYRYQVTGDAQALANVETSVDSLLTLSEITGDPATFARTIRPASGNAVLPWHAGTGAFADLDWLETGNNDMYKGLLYGWLTAYEVLCEGPGAPGHDAVCVRIRADAASVADHVTLVQSAGLNQLNARWLAAYVTGDPSRIADAKSAWFGQAGVVKAGNALVYSNGIADWSGTHLNFVEFIAMKLLEEKLDVSYLGENAASDIATGIDAIHGMLGKQRIGLWDLAFASLAATPDPAAKTDALLRLSEFPCPKMQMDVDHRVAGSFVMSPYPSLPWKFDWTTNDRSQSLRGYPLFETSAGVYTWKDNVLSYKTNGTGAQHPGADYLHAYWLGRKLGVLTATD